MRMLPAALGNRAQHFSNLNAHETGAGATRIGDVWEIDEATSDYFLGVLPPLQWQGSSFLVSEALTGDIHAAYFEHRGSHYCGYVRGPAARAEIAALRAFVAAA